MIKRCVRHHSWESPCHAAMRCVGATHVLHSVFADMEDDLTVGTVITTVCCQCSRAGRTHAIQGPFLAHAETKFNFENRFANRNCLSCTTWRRAASVHSGSLVPQNTYETAARPLATCMVNCGWHSAVREGPNPAEDSPDLQGP